mmetsp:Transcript_8123/g.11715  ORF Transcript_8123/g.11715 Transcript_8123/m.11715 type:complete len:202 (-) Transcript_8123:440-1045(-)
MEKKLQASTTRRLGQSRSLINSLSRATSKSRRKTWLPLTSKPPPGDALRQHASWNVDLKPARQGLTEDSLQGEEGVMRRLAMQQLQATQVSSLCIDIACSHSLQFRVSRISPQEQDLNGANARSGVAVKGAKGLWTCREEKEKSLQRCPRRWKAAAEAAKDNPRNPSSERSQTEHRVSPGEKLTKLDQFKALSERGAGVQN